MARRIIEMGFSPNQVSYTNTGFAIEHLLLALYPEVNHQARLRMKISKSKQDQILSAIGLTLSGDIISYEESQFTKYISPEYMHSERRQSDDIYRMFEITLLHRDSGLRLVYTTTESYYGDCVEYKLIDIFIITLTQKRMEIVDVDFTNKVLLTPNETIPFAEVNRLPE